MNEEKKKSYFTNNRNDYKSRIAASALAAIIVLVASLFASYTIFNNKTDKPIISPDFSQNEDSSVASTPSEDNISEDQSLIIDNSNIDESIYDQSIEPSNSDEISISEESLVDNSETPDESIQEESIEIIYGETFNNIYVYGDTAVTLLGGSSSNEAKFAEIINQYKEKLGNSINLYTAIVPTYVDFYKNGDGNRVTTAHQDQIINNIYSLINDSVITIDVYSTISSHIDEYLYYRLDPNWTPLGAYYAYYEIAKSMGFEPTALDDFEKGYIEEYAGENYRNVKLTQLLNNPDSITFYKVDKLFPSTVNHYYTDGTERIDTQMVYSSVSNPLSYGYMIYGDRGYYSNAFTENKNGKKILVLKDDSGISLAPFLVAHFEEVHIADIRHFKSYSNQTLETFISENEITDVLILMYTSNARSTYRINNLYEFLNGSDDVQQWVF